MFLWQKYGDFCSYSNSKYSSVLVRIFDQTNNGAFIIDFYLAGCTLSFEQHRALIVDIVVPHYH